MQKLSVEFNSEEHACDTLLGSDLTKLILNLALALLASLNSATL